MARISGMILGLSLLVALSVIASPASAWDSDDDDDDRPRLRRKPHHGHAAPIVVPPIVRQPIFAPPIYDDRHDYDYAPNRYEHNPRRDPIGPAFPPEPEYQAVPRYPSNPQVPFAPPPLPPEELFGNDLSDPITGPSFAAGEREPAVVPEYRAGEFVPVEMALYPHVRVKGRDEVPRSAVPRLIAVKSPDPFRFPGLVYVQVYTLPGRPEEFKVEEGGAKVEMKYDDFEIKILSDKGVVSVEYDD